ncbi:hypothetical protein QO179_12775 [Bacillus stercoris]|nr:hypothetical protein [Bacillus stercoris]
MNLIRNILIVDDSLNLELDITQYDGIFKRIKRDLFLDYEINFFNERKYDKAIELLNSTDHTFDVLLIDYDLSSAGNEKSGIDLVKEIRNGINRHCKIIFIPCMNYLLFFLIERNWSYYLIREYSNFCQKIWKVKVKKNMVNGHTN